VTSAKANLQAAEQSVTAQVETARTTLQATRQRLALAKDTRAIAAKQLAAEEARFNTGASTALQVSQAQDQLRQANLRVLRAQVDLTETAIKVFHLTGALLSTYGGELATR
jgi:outer membrane protein TolC